MLCVCAIPLSFIFAALLSCLCRSYDLVCHERGFTGNEALSLSSFKILAIFVLNDQYLAEVVFSLYWHILQRSKIRNSKDLIFYNVQIIATIATLKSRRRNRALPSIIWRGLFLLPSPTFQMNPQVHLPPLRLPCSPPPRPPRRYYSLATQCAWMFQPSVPSRPLPSPCRISK